MDEPSFHAQWGSRWGCTYLLLRKTTRGHPFRCIDMCLYAYSRRGPRTISTKYGINTSLVEEGQEGFVNLSTKHGMHYAPWSIDPSIHPYYLFFYPSIHPSIYLSSHSSIYFSIHPSISLSIHPSIYRCIKRKFLESPWHSYA